MPKQNDAKQFYTESSRVQWKSPVRGTLANNVLVPTLPASSTLKLRNPVKFPHTATATVKSNLKKTLMVIPPAQTRQILNQQPARTPSLLPHRSSILISSHSPVSDHSSAPPVASFLDDHIPVFSFLVIANTTARHHVQACACRGGKLAGHGGHDARFHGGQLPRRAPGFTRASPPFCVLHARLIPIDSRFVLGRQQDLRLHSPIATGWMLSLKTPGASVGCFRGKSCWCARALARRGASISSRFCPHTHRAFRASLAMGMCVTLSGGLWWRNG